jgi:hypothetical protein
MREGLVMLSLFLSGCSFGAGTLPQRPALPEVAYVAPCDAQAVVGLTPEAVETLRNRDLLLRRHIELLEQQLQGTSSVPVPLP